MTRTVSVETALAVEALARRMLPRLVLAGLGASGGDESLPPLLQDARGHEPDVRAGTTNPAVWMTRRRSCGQLADVILECRPANHLVCRAPNLPTPISGHHFVSV